MPDLNDEPALRQLRQFKNAAVTRAFFARHQVHSVGIGRKIVDGRRTDQLALRLYVAQKLPRARITRVDKIPSVIPFVSPLSDELFEVVTDVIETPPPIFEHDPTLRHRPVPGGVSVDAISGTAGTLGGWVWDLTDDTIVGLSNHHIFGDTTGTDTIQPGPFDGGATPGDKIGDVKRGIPRSTSVTNTVDAAITDADTTDVYELQVKDIGPAVYAIEVPVLDMLVEKSGRTTGHTFGIIDDIDYETTVSGFPFDDCIRVEAEAPSADWSAGGDSGSLVFSQTPISEGSVIKPVVGLHFAGPAGGTYGVGCKIQNVFSQLNLTTLCSGAFESLLESLAGEAVEVPETADRMPAPSRTVEPRLPVFTGRARKVLRATRPQFGLARDLQRRLVKTERGRLLDAVVQNHRGALLGLLVHDGDVRRRTLTTLRPLLKGATTTDDVLDRVLDADDVARLGRLASEVGARDEAVGKAIEPLLRLLDGAEGKRIGELLG